MRQTRPHARTSTVYDSEPKAFTVNWCPASLVVLVLGIGGMRVRHLQDNHTTGQREFQASRRPDELCKSQSQASIKLLRWADESDLKLYTVEPRIANWGALHHEGASTRKFEEPFLVLSCYT